MRNKLTKKLNDKLELYSFFAIILSAITFVFLVDVLFRDYSNISFFSWFVLLSLLALLLICIFKIYSAFSDLNNLTNYNNN